MFKELGEPKLFDVVINTIAVFFVFTWLSRVRMQGSWIQDPQKAFVTEDALRNQKPFNYKDDKDDVH